MGHPVVRESDKIDTPPPAPAVWVTPPVVTLKGSSGFTVAGKSVCLPVDIEGMSPPVTAQYTTLAFPSPGSGTINFTLASGHRALKTTSKGQPVVVDDDTPLTFVFTVTGPATNPAPGQPPSDLVPTYSGTATFLRNPMPKPVTAG
ncbi:hypothetical protein [Streptomyces sp. H27-H5]|uniref:hypothetical protein n=1 Tax=Streptomyces sp. H27-H5 TaxID=2996460 RepID=UPI003B640CB9